MDRHAHEGMMQGAFRLSTIFGSKSGANRAGANTGSGQTQILTHVGRGGGRRVSLAREKGPSQ